MCVNTVTSRNDGYLYIGGVDGSSEEQEKKI